MRRLNRLVPSFVLVLSLSCVTGCDDKKKEAPVATATPDASIVATTAPEAGSATADAGEATADTGKQDAHMANCPTAVPGATVTLKDVEGGIEISVTGKDDAATKDIKARMAKLVEADKKELGAGVKHDHSGGGGGVYGRCTIVMRNTKLETADLPNGAKATVKAEDKTEVDWVRRETRDRDKAAKSPSAEGAGVRKMANCPSAVEGAKTAVKNSKEGVIVTVTGNADTVNDIRERAKHAAEVAKKAEGSKVEHTSEGKGGGGLGRCPVVVDGATDVAVKDIDNGVEITVKAKKDVPALQKEAKARAANFGANAKKK